MNCSRYEPSWDVDLAPLLSCKLCLGEFPLEQMTTISQCQCIFCSLRCSWILVGTWCPSSSCQAVCQLKEAEVQMPQPVQCPQCSLRFCSSCREECHTGQACQESLPITTFLPRENSYSLKNQDDEAPIKCCPKCKVYIERDEGCAQMMCKKCKHAFCWYCLESLDDDFLLIHYDKGPCEQTGSFPSLRYLASDTGCRDLCWLRSTLVSGLPFILLATPFVLCCKCKCKHGNDDPLPS